MGSSVPLVSVLMPVYNGLETLPKAIHSLQLQTYTNWKLIVVNDGSTDGTKEYLDVLTESESKLKVIHLEKNCGRGNARNLCLENAEGEFVAFLDSDDMYFPTKLEKQVNYLVENPTICLVGCGVGILEEGNEINFVRGNKYANRIFSHKKNENLQFMAPTVMFRFSGGQIKFNARLDIMEDVDFFNRFLEGKKYSILPDYLYYYSEIGKVSKKKLLKYSLHTIKYYLIFSKDDIKLIFNVFNSLFQLIYKFVYIQIFGVDQFLKKRSRVVDVKVKIELESFLRKNVIA